MFLFGTERLHWLGQSLWLDDITRELIDSGTLATYIAEKSITGLTSNPSIFDHAITNGRAYDGAIAYLRTKGLSSEDLFFELAIEDLSRAADLFLPIHRRTATVDGWVSLEVSPLLAHDTRNTVASAEALYAKANKPNLFIKIPGTKEGLPAIEETIYRGVPVNVTLLFSPEQYGAAANAYMSALERRVDEGLSPDVRSVASLFVSRWDRAVAEIAPEHLKNRLGIAIGKLAYKAYRECLESRRWQRLENHGARAQRLLFASTGTKDPKASDVLYADALAAPNTVDTLPQNTLRALADHGAAATVLPADGGDGAAIVMQFGEAGVNIAVLADKLQAEGADAFVQAWRDLLRAIDLKAKVAT